MTNGLDERGMTIEGHGPGGFWAKVSGGDLKSLFVVIIILLACGAIWVQNDKIADQQDQRSQADRKIFLEQHSMTQKLLAQVITNQQAIIQAIGQGQNEVARGQAVMTYVLSLDTNERRALNLQMPDELRYGYAQGTKEKRR